LRFSVRDGAAAQLLPLLFLRDYAGDRASKAKGPVGQSKSSSHFLKPLFTFLRVHTKSGLSHSMMVYTQATPLGHFPLQAHLATYCAHFLLFLSKQVCEVHVIVLCFLSAVAPWPAEAAKYQSDQERARESNYYLIFKNISIFKT
jgi:hypothetical protein